MLLAIDAGNTSTVFAAIDSRSGDIRASWRMSTDLLKGGEDQLFAVAKMLGDSGIDTSDVDCAIVACVVPDILPYLKAICVGLCDCPPLVIGEDSVDIGIDVKIDRPEEVGADRLVNAVAAFAEAGGAAIVVDFGTATTFDVVGADGAYLGGVISPGIHLSLKALFEAAANLPLIEVEEPSGGVTGKNTLDAMRSGIFWGYIGLIEGIIKRIKAEHGGDIRVIATGGLAGIFADRTDAIDSVDRALTIKGLALVAARNFDKGNLGKGNFDQGEK